MRHGKASGTAKIVAFYRALADAGVTTVPKFRDPFALQLLHGRLWRAELAIFKRIMLADDPRVHAARSEVDGLILRVAFLDAMLSQHLAPQVVILGAGLDTRAWRLPALRGVRVFEVDHPATQAYKRAHAQRLPAPLAQLSFVPIDFTRDSLEQALRDAGHDPQTPTVWLWEGVIMYLDDTPLREALAAMRGMSCPGSTLLAHYHEPDPHGEPASYALVRRLVLQWLGEPQVGMRPRAVMRTELARAGWCVLQDVGADEQAQTVGGVAPTTPIGRVSRIVVAQGS